MIPEILAAAGFNREPPEHPVVFADIAGQRVRLKIDFQAISDLEMNRGASVETLLSRFAGFSLYAEDICEVLRVALMGGDEVSPQLAGAIVETYVKPAVADYRNLAERVLTAAFSGIDPQPLAQPGEGSGTGESPAI